MSVSYNKTCSNNNDGTSLIRRKSDSNQLHSFLASRRLEPGSGQSHTHVMLGLPYGTYNVSVDDYGDFYKFYAKSMRNNDPLYLAENPCNEIPILVDIDLKVRREPSMTDVKSIKLYDDKSLEHVVSCYQQVLREILVDLDEESLLCVVLEKNAYEQTCSDVSFVKNGFHLHFPKLFVDRRVQEVYLLPLVKSKCFSREFSSCVDENSINIHWLMYGSKKPDRSAYRVTKCYDSRCRVVEPKRALRGYRVAMDKRYPIDFDRSDFETEILPRVLSIFLYDRLEYYYKPKSSVDTPIMDKYAEIKSLRKPYEQIAVKEYLNEAKVMLDMMSDARSDDYRDWLNCGFCIHNISNGDDDGLTLWLAFSERSPKYNEFECLSKWNAMRANQYTIATLRYFAKCDNPVEYERYFKEKTTALMYRSLSGNHNDIAKMLFNDFGTEIVCACPKSKLWFYFDKHIWKESALGLSLRERISDERNGVYAKFNALLRHYKYEYECDENTSKKKRRKLNDERYDSDDERDERDERDENVKSKIKSIEKVLRDCKSAPFKNHVMSECVEVFRNESFLKLLNKDPYLVAFENGVYDFRVFKFRPGKPEDYLSVSIPVYYVDYGTEDRQEIMEIKDFFRKIFPDVSMREYFLNVICELFIGGNAEKICMIWTGDGDNGKSLTQELFEKMLGPLSVKFSPSLICGKRYNVGAATPELVRAGNGVRWAVFDEPNHDERINGGMIKVLTGGDSLFARDLFQTGKSVVEIKPMFRPVIICNTIPQLPTDADDATRNRFRVIEFETKFYPANDPRIPKSYEEQWEKKIFPIDGSISQKVGSMLAPLAWYLINRCKNLNRSQNRINVPEKVLAATNAYRQDNNVYLQFVNAYVEKLDIASPESCSMTQMYNQFQIWFRHSQPNDQMPAPNIVKQRVNSILKISDRFDGTRWRGVRLNSTTASSSPTDDR